jgi:hypothetical protein
MNTSSRVPGVSRNSGWQAIDAEIASHELSQQQTRAWNTACGQATQAEVKLYADDQVLADPRRGVEPG